MKWISWSRNENKMAGFKCQNKTKYMQVNAELNLEFNV